MWMMGCGGIHNSLNKTADSGHHARRSSSLRPLISRVHQPLPHNLLPSSTFPSSTVKATDHFFSLQSLSSSSPTIYGIEQNRSNECTGPSAGVSSRWNPTPEQLCALEDLYRSGIRTPTADQIQYITTQLRRFGKIEGKNVFYWFQNHKARERQKHRRRSEVALELGPYMEYHSRSKSSQYVGRSASAERNKSSGGPGLRVEISEEDKLVGWQRELYNQKHQQRNRRTIFTIEERTVQQPSLQLLQSSQYTPPPPPHSDAFTAPNLTTEETPANSLISCRNIQSVSESKHLQEEACMLMEDNNSHGVRETLELFPLRSQNSSNSMNIIHQVEQHHDINIVDAVTVIEEAEKQACLQGGYFFQFLPLKN